MICLKCKEIIKKKDCLCHPARPDKLYCPKCKHIVFDFGQEFLTISEKDKIKQFDENSQKFVKQTGDVYSYYTTIEIDTKIIECLDSIKISPKDIETRVVLGKLYFSKKDFKNALKEFLTVNDLCNGFHYEASSIIAQIYASIKTYSKALKYSKLMLKHDPENVQILINIANCYYGMKKYKNCAVTLKAALSMDSKNKELRDMMKHVLELVKTKSE